MTDIEYTVTIVPDDQPYDVSPDHKSTSEILKDQTDVYALGKNLNFVPNNSGDFPSLTPGEVKLRAASDVKRLLAKSL